MSKRIPQWFINELLVKVDIVDVIRSRIKLKKSGYNYSACCPFHQEKTPSFTVNQTKQFFYCFGCGAHGSALGFLMDFEHLSYPEAIDKLAGSLGIALPAISQSEQDHYAQQSLYYKVLNDAAEYWANNLRQKDSQIAVDYLKNKRGLTGQIAKEFKIGFAGDSWTQLVDFLTQQGWNKKQLKTMGLMRESANGRLYDYFRNRIMFPIRNKKGQTIAFGGRVIKDGSPKYLNSPETPLFQKGSSLYGLYESLQKKNESVVTGLADIVFVVEGYMDVIALQQLGIANVVACLGTAITSKQIKQLFYHYPTIIFCFDGDKAGEKAALRALETSISYMEEGRACKFVFFPEGQDPDMFIRAKGVACFKELALQGLVLSKYLLQYCQQQCDMSSTEGRAKLIGLMKPYLQQLADGLYRFVVLEDLAKLVSIDVNKLYDSIFSKEVKVDITKALPRKHGRMLTRKLLRKNKKVILTPALRVMSLVLQNRLLIELLSEQQWHGLKACQLEECILCNKVLNYFKQVPIESLGGVLDLIKDEITDKEAELLLGPIANKSWSLEPSAMEVEFLSSIDKLLLDNQVFVEQKLIGELANKNVDELSFEQKQKIKELYK